MLDKGAPIKVQLVGEGDHRQLEQLATRLEHLLSGRPELAKRARRLVERIATERFHIAVLGEFKRGKSTLVNALIGQPLLPTGVAPLTAVATEVHFGSTETTVVFDGGKRMNVDPHEIGTYVTERGNPSNARGVERLELGVPATFGAPGVVLVDTPGVSSVYEHNTTAARAALVDSDAVVLVMSADSPLSESELSILTEVSQRGSKMFVVINKSDHLSKEELDEVVTFVVDRLLETGAEWSGPFCVAARSVLDPAGDDQAREGFLTFKTALKSFVEDDLASARRASIVSELTRLAEGLNQSQQIEASTITMDSDTLESQLRKFEAAVRDGQQILNGDRVVLDHEVSVLLNDGGDRLVELAATAAQSCLPSLAIATNSLPLRNLGTGLRDVIENCVTEQFEPVRQRVEREIEEAWRIAADRFCERVQLQLDGLIASANELFDVHLPKVPVPAVGGKDELFDYLFVHVESETAVIGHLLTALLPSRLARRRALRLGKRYLFQQFDRFAGRARHDLSERLQSTKREFVSAMMAEFECTQASISDAARGTQALLSINADERTLLDQNRRELRRVIEEIAQLQDVGVRES
ncbi:MAG: dynamin family protein [Actinobacteria bacterium]|nr:dynamin family protein [Actinomycetota bacterium]MCL5444942.1 dynamin family protein [Actinomycetota bacterium]